MHTLHQANWKQLALKGEMGIGGVGREAWGKGVGVLGWGGGLGGQRDGDQKHDGTIMMMITMVIMLMITITIYKT